MNKPERETEQNEENSRSTTFKSSSKKDGAERQASARQERHLELHEQHPYYAFWIGILSRCETVYEI